MSTPFAVALSALALAAATHASPVAPRTLPAAPHAVPAALPAHVAAPALAPAPALWGPPAICHPIDIGDAASLPWGDGAFEIDPRYDRAQLVPDTLALLDAGEDLLVHMETLRRATILITGLATPRDPSAKQIRADAHALGAALEARLVRARAAVSDPAAPNPAAARALFDLGYLSAALAQASSALAGDDGSSRLVEAAKLLDKDPAAQLGVVLATCGHGTPNAVTWSHLDKLFTLTEDRGDPWKARVAKNATFIVGPFLGVGARDRDALAALAHERHQDA